MNFTTKTGKTIGLTIPEKYYRAMQILRECSDNNTSWSGNNGELAVRPIKGTSYIYDHFRTCMERLVDWLLDQTKDFGYRTAAFCIIGWKGSTVTLQETDNPFDCFWANNVVDHISDHYRFGGLLEQWQNDP